MKKAGALFLSAFLCAAFVCQTLAGDYFAVHSHDFDWTRNLSVFHTEEYTYLYSEHVNTIKDGYWYLPMFTELRLTVRDRDGNELEDDATIKTGDRLTETRDGESVILSTFVYGGDVEADGQIDAADARKTLNAAVGLVSLSDAEQEAADLDNDGIVTPEDARNILRKSVHLPAQLVKEGGFWDDHIYQTTLLVWMPLEDRDAGIAALRSDYDEITDARILNVDFVNDTQAVYVLLYVKTYEDKCGLAEKISAGGKSIEVNHYDLL